MGNERKISPLDESSSRQIWVGWGAGLVSLGLAYFLGGPFWAEPPLLTGAVHEREAWVLPPVAVRLVGGPGTVTGVEETRFEGVEVPTPFWASTSKS
jgi:hypothetical protein